MDGALATESVILPPDGSDSGTSWAVHVTANGEVQLEAQTNSEGSDVAPERIVTGLVAQRCAGGREAAARRPSS